MILDGKKVAGDIRSRLKDEILSLKENNIVPGLAVVLVGNDAASKVYVSSKEKACAELGIYSKVHRLDESAFQEDVEKKVEELNENEKIHGILVQLPLPKHLDERKVLDLVDPSKDVDCFHPCNVGKIMIGDTTGFLPCTPAGVMELLKSYKIELESKHCVIVGRSNIVGKPLSLMMLGEDATVTVCHSKTRNLEEICQSADILVSAVGKPGLITKNMLKQGAVVVDVGINRLPDGKLVGDVDFEAASHIVSAITPVPGGVGPMTIAMLMRNVVSAAKRKQ